MISAIITEQPTTSAIATSSKQPASNKKTRRSANKTSQPGRGKDTVKIAENTLGSGSSEQQPITYAILAEVKPRLLMANGQPAPSLYEAGQGIREPEPPIHQEEGLHFLSEQEAAHGVGAPD
ncbi:hypothetical protein NX059_010587 [Plenodomus lindquistii]|nr:hypothetical protein NX059_010587 [Plenodomus lindquistii]